MTWRAIAERRLTSVPRPATIAVFRRGKRPDIAPTTTITIARYFSEKLGWPVRAPIGILIGDDDARGRVRLVVNGTPAVANVRQMKRGTIFLDLGHLPELGGSPGQSERVLVEIIDANTIELTLPDWDSVPVGTSIRARDMETGVPRPVSPPRAERQDPDDDEDAPPPRRVGRPSNAERVARQLASVPVVGTVPTAPQAAKPATSAAPVKLHGVEIVIAKDDERVIFGGKETDLTANQAALAVVLLKAAPSPVGEEFARVRVLGTTAGAADRFKTIVADLANALPTVGLGLKQMKGVGLQLTGVRA